MYRTGVAAKRIYEDEGLHGMDVRRYLAFAATFKYHFGEFPDQTYWTSLDKSATILDWTGMACRYC